MNEEYLTYGRQLQEYVADTTRLVWDALEQGDLVLFEGAQGTSSTSTRHLSVWSPRRTRSPVPACVGAGVGPRDIERLGRLQGIHDARRSGSFPDELADEMGERNRERGNEYGTTTGRPRRTAGSTSSRCATPRA